MDHQFAPDVQGAIDDWSDFSVTLVNEEMREHHSINPSDVSAFSSPFSSHPYDRSRVNPSSTWRNDKDSVDNGASGPTESERVINIRVPFPHPEVVRGMFEEEREEMERDAAQLKEKVESKMPRLSHWSERDDVNLPYPHPEVFGGIHDPDQEVWEKEHPGIVKKIEGKGKELVDKLKGKAAKAEESVEKGVEKVKDNVEKAVEAVEKGAKDVGKDVRAEQEALSSRLEVKKERAENHLSQIKKDIKEDLRSLGHQTEEAAATVKNKAAEEIEKGKEGIEGAKDKAEGVFHRVGEKIKGTFSSSGVEQAEEPVVTVLPNTTVVIEDWGERKKEKEQGKHSEGLFGRLFGWKAESKHEDPLLDAQGHPLPDPSSYHKGPAVEPKGVKSNNALDLPAKEPDAHLDMVGEKKTLIPFNGRVTDKATGGPFPASNIPSKERLDQSQVNDLKHYPSTMGTAEKDLYAPNRHTQMSGRNI